MTALYSPIQVALDYVSPAPPSPGSSMVPGTPTGTAQQQYIDLVLRQREADKLASQQHYEQLGQGPAPQANGGGNQGGGRGGGQAQTGVQPYNQPWQPKPAQIVGAVLGVFLLIGLVAYGAKKRKRARRSYAY